MELCQRQGELGFERGTGRGESLRVSRWGAPGQGLQKGPYWAAPKSGPPPCLHSSPPLPTWPVTLLQGSPGETAWFELLLPQPEDQGHQGEEGHV